MRENRLARHSRNSENHMTYAEALRQSGYQGDNGVVVLSKKMSAARVRGVMDATVNVAVDALVGMSQTPGNESAIIKGGEKTHRPDRARHRRGARGIRGGAR